MFAPWREGHYQNLFDLNKNTIAPECKYYIACNYNNDRDKRDFDYFCNVLPKNNTIKIRVDDRPSIHHIAYTLRENGVFSEFCKQILNTGTVIENPLIIIDKE
jgi:hypothetical protein